MSYRPLFVLLALALGLLMARPLCAQGIASDPIPDPLGGGMDPLTVGIQEFAFLPDIDGVAARMQTLVDEPTTGRLFVSDQRGPIYTVSYDGRTVTRYVDTNDPRWSQQVQSQGRERGVQSFAIHPQFGQPGTPGYGKLYTWSDVQATGAAPDFRPSGGDHTHDMVLLEWTARNHASPTYDGTAPRELFRVEDPFTNHNGGRVTFNPLAPPTHPDYGLLYIGVADGGSGGDPFNHAQNLGSIFGKVLRIDPLGRNSANGKYGIPPSNPFQADDDPATLGEIYAYGVRNPQHIAWDRATGRMWLTDIGQGTIEEISVVTPGANLGWNQWEGSYRFGGGRGGISTENARSDAKVTYPVAEYDQTDPLLGGRVAVTGLAIYRGDEIGQLYSAALFGDLPNGEMFAVSADHPPSGGQSGMRRILFTHGGQAKTFLSIIQEKNGEQGKALAERADLRFYEGNERKVYLLNKADGTIRVLAP
jgi:hypothetical protein